LGTLIHSNRMILQHSTDPVTDSFRHSQYQSLDVEYNDENPSAVTERAFKSNIAAKALYFTLFGTVFTMTCIFYFYTTFYTFTNSISIVDHSMGRKLLECSSKDVGISAATGALLGTGLVVGTFLALGLMPFVGPMAGGLFASNMGAGLASGSLMAVAQSAAMTGVAYGTGAAIGASGGTLLACT